MSKLLTHGYKKRYCIRYNDNPDFGPLTEPDQEWRCWAYDHKHAIQLFDDSSHEEGWVALQWAVLAVSDDGLTRCDQDMVWHNIR